MSAKTRIYEKQTQTVSSSEVLRHGAGNWLVFQSGRSDEGFGCHRARKYLYPLVTDRRKAGADYQGDGLAISPTTVGARLRCVFQRLEAEATREGCWLTSTATAAVNDRFRIVAVALGREPNVARPSRLRVNGRLRTAPLRTTRRRPNSQARTPALRLKSRSRAPAQWKWRKTSPALFGPDLPKNTA